MFSWLKPEEKPKDIRPWIQDFCDAVVSGRVRLTEVSNITLIHVKAYLFSGVEVRLSVEDIGDYRFSKYLFSCHRAFANMSLNGVDVPCLTADEKFELMSAVNIWYMKHIHDKFQRELDKLVIPVVQEPPAKPKKAK